MKLKHSATFALALWMGVVAWVGAMVVAKPTAFSGQQADQDGAVAAQLQQQVAHGARLQQALSELARPRRLSTGATIIAAAPQNAGVDGTDTAGMAIGTRTVTLIMAVDRARRALIDGEWVQRGSRLPDGSRVLAIGTDRVRIEDADGQPQVLKMRPPYADATTATEARR